MSGPTVVGQHYVLAVPDIEDAATWWTEIMGFAVWMKPEGWVYVRRADLLRRAGRAQEAADAYEAAIAATQNAAERRFLARRRAAIDLHPAGDLATSKPTRDSM